MSTLLRLVLVLWLSAALTAANSSSSPSSPPPLPVNDAVSSPFGPAFFSADSALQPPVRLPTTLSGRVFDADADDENDVENDDEFLLGLDAVQQLLDRGSSPPPSYSGPPLRSPPGFRSHSILLPSSSVRRRPYYSSSSSSSSSLLSSPPSSLASHHYHPTPPSPPPYSPPVVPPYPSLPTGLSLVSSVIDASVTVSFDSLQKVVQVSLFSLFLAYVSVSPRSLPPSLYNSSFQENVLLLSLLYLGALLSFACVFDPQFSDVNVFISTFYASFFFAYPLLFAVELLLTTAVRLLVFAVLEPRVFALCPAVPSVLLPWSLSKSTYRPSESTTLTCELLTSLLLCPLVEESAKLLVARLSFRSAPPPIIVGLPRDSRPGAAAAAAAAVLPVHPPSSPSVNPYVCSLLASTLGLKLADATRRVLVYTRPGDADKRVYALLRGINPVQELCGALSALAWARGELLEGNLDGGSDGIGGSGSGGGSTASYHLPHRTTFWKAVGPAALFHAAAVWRGKKPISKWGSSTPWAELQIGRWSGGPAEDTASLQVVLGKMAKSLLWSYWLFKCFGHCFKQYFVISRLALKRATRYKGHEDKFVAELNVDRILLNEKEAAASLFRVADVFKRDHGSSSGSGRRFV